MTDGVMSPADYAAINGRTGDDGIFGGNSWAWIIVLFLFMWGRFRTLDGAICNLGYQALQNTNAIQSQMAQCCCDTRAAIKDVGTQSVINTGELSRQIERCCCDAEKSAMQTRFDAQAYNCNTLQAIDKLGDRIIDYMAADKAQALRDENQALRLAASQAAQNEALKSYMSGQFAYYNPRPVPSYDVPAPYPYCYNGCGCRG